VASSLADVVMPYCQLAVANAGQIHAHKVVDMVIVVQFAQERQEVQQNVASLLPCQVAVEKAALVYIQKVVDMVNVVQFAQKSQVV